MANLQIKDIEDSFYAEIKALAASENRSMNQEVLYLLKDSLTKESQIKKTKTAAQVLLALSGSWIDPKSEDVLVHQIKKSRVNSKKLSEGFRCFFSTPIRLFFHGGKIEVL